MIIIGLLSQLCVKCFFVNIFIGDVKVGSHFVLELVSLVGPVLGFARGYWSADVFCESNFREFIIKLTHSSCFVH